MKHMRTDEQIKSKAEAIMSEINSIKNESNEDDSFSVSLQKSIRLAELTGKLDMLIWVTKEIK